MAEFVSKQRRVPNSSSLDIRIEAKNGFEYGELGMAGEDLMDWVEALEALNLVL